MGWNGMGKLIEVEGKLDAVRFWMMEWLKALNLGEDEQYFQQDNNPKCTSRLATQWFSDNHIQVLEWPAQSPDINPIEYL